MLVLVDLCWRGIHRVRVPCRGHDPYRPPIETGGWTLMVAEEVEKTARNAPARTHATRISHYRAFTGPIRRDKQLSGTK